MESQTVNDQGFDQFGHQREEPRIFQIETLAFNQYLSKRSSFSLKSSSSRKNAVISEHLWIEMDRFKHRKDVLDS